MMNLYMYDYDMHSYVSLGVCFLLSNEISDEPFGFDAVHVCMTVRCRTRFS